MKRMTGAVLLLVLLLSGCGVSNEEYGAVCAERDALRAELQELQGTEEPSDTVTVKVQGSFTADRKSVV